MIELTHRGIRAMATVAGSGLLDGLREHDPVVAGPCPLGLDRPDSNVDVLCCAPPTTAFVEQVAAVVPDAQAFTWHRDRVDAAYDAVIVTLHLDGLPVEVIAQARPTREQRAYRGLVVARRLLVLGGAPLQTRVRDEHLRSDQIELEAAFARALRMDGEPVTALLRLEAQTDAQLRELIRAALGDSRHLESADQ